MQCNSDNILKYKDLYCIIMRAAYLIDWSNDDLYRDDSLSGDDIKPVIFNYIKKDKDE